MLRKLFYSLVITSLTLSLGACATSAQTQDMVYSHASSAKPKNSTLLHNVAIADVTGGEATNPMWKSKISNENFNSALQQSLQQSKLYHDLKGSRYNLSVTLMELSQPSMGFDFTVRCQVRYQLLDTKTNKYIFRKDVSSFYTADMSSSLVGATRLRLATEGAAKANIQQLIDGLYKIPASK